MVWHEIRGSEISFLEEVMQSYQKIADDHNKLLLEHHTEWEKIPSDLVDDDGRLVKEYTSETLGDESYSNDEIQQVLALSFVMTICMTVENELGQLCSHLQKEFKEKILLKDFRGGGRGIKSRIDYIETLTEKKFLNKNNELKMLIDFRNIIAHDNGMVTIDQQNALRSKYNGMTLEFPSNKIRIEIESLPNYLKLADAIMKEITEFWTYETNPLGN